MANTTWSNNWMSGIDDNARLSEISIPGTHDSCSRFNNAPRTQTQWFSIIQLLNRGIRFLDIRCLYVADPEKGRTQNIYFPIRHGTVFQNIFLEEVQAQCIAFLIENPSETIIMNVQMEYEGNGDQFRDKFLEITGPYTNYWYTQSSTPTLGACRGKIVLVRAYDSAANKGWTKKSDGTFAGGLEWNGFNIDGLSSNNIFYTQNGWAAWSGTEKGEEVKKYIALAGRDSSHITLNFSSYAKDSGPWGNAMGMNPMLQNFLQTYNPQSWAINLGVIPIDFIGITGDTGKSLENLIIERQVKQKPGFSYGGIVPWLLTESK